MKKSVPKSKNEILLFFVFFIFFYFLVTGKFLSKWRHQQEIGGRAAEKRRLKANGEGMSWGKVCGARKSSRDPLPPSPPTTTCSHFLFLFSCCIEGKNVGRRCCWRNITYAYNYADIKTSRN